MDTTDKHIVAIDLGSSKIALTVAKVNGADIQIIYYKESVDGSEFIIDHIETKLVNAGTEVTAPITSIEHFTFDASRSKTSGKATALTVDPNTGGLAQGLVLSLYYTRNEYSYTVNHYKQNSSVPMETVTGTAKYGQTIYIDDIVKEFPGYTFVAGKETEFVISNDGVTIQCYYQGLEVHYQYQVMGMGATIANNTETVAMSADDFFGVFLPAVGHEPFFVEIHDFDEGEVIAIADVKYEGQSILKK